MDEERKVLDQFLQTSKRYLTAPALEPEPPQAVRSRDPRAASRSAPLAAAIDRRRSPASVIWTYAARQR